MEMEIFWEEEVMEKRFELGEYNERQSEYLGTAVWWEVNPCRVPLDSMVDALEAHGFDQKAIRKPSAKKAFSRATSDVEKQHKDVLARRIADLPQKAVVGIVGEQADAERESLSYNQEATVRLNKETGTVDSEGDEEIGNEFREKFGSYLDVVTEVDLRAFVRKAIENSDGIRLREKGLVYFVPRKNEERMVALDEMLKELHVGKLGVMRVVNGIREREETWDSFQENLRERVEEALEGAERISKSAKCLARYEDRIDQIGKMADAYVELCEEEERADQIREMLQEAGAKIAGKMAELRKDK
jgi:hypothetical protein